MNVRQTLLFIASITLSLSSQASNLTEVYTCVFDPIGANGPSKEVVDEYKVAALRWGVQTKSSYYTDDQEAMAAFEAGECDVVSLPDFRVRKYNRFTGSISALASIPSYKHLGSVIKSLAAPGAEKVMRVGDYEVIGIYLIGGVHGFVSNREWNTPESMVGKKMAMLTGIEEAAYMMEQTGMVAIESDLGTMFNNFKSGKADATVAPLIVYEGLELKKGLGEKGGITRYSTGIVTMQLVARVGKLPAGAEQQSREFVANYHPKMVSIVESYEATVPDHYWYDVPQEAIYHWDNVFTKARKDLAEQGIYDKKMLRLLKKVRCKSYPDRAECNSEAF